MRSELLLSHLSLIERLGHARRTRSVRSALMSIVDVLCRYLVPRWWAQTAPWYAGRVIERLRLHLRIDGNIVNAAGRSGDNTFMKGLLWLERYEGLERYAIAKFLRRSLPLVELGASIGVLACLANRKLTKPQRQIAIEANPFLIPVLTKNRDDNHLQFRIIHGALAYGSESVEFGISDSAVASSLKTDRAVTTVTVRAVCLQEILRDMCFEVCTLICDIEGTEMALVETEGGVLRRHVKTLIMEVHPESMGPGQVEDLAMMLGRLKFLLVWRKRNVWVLENQEI